MILESLDVAPAEFERRTGWVIKPEGACKGEWCVPLLQPAGVRLDARRLAERLGMPLVQDDATGLWALGPESGGKALLSAEAPELELPDRHGRPCRLRSLLGQKVLLVTWASW